MRRLLLLATPVLLSGCGWEARAGSAGDEAFYQGKVLEIIVPFGPGGGTDIWARALAPHLQMRLGDRAAVQVVNIPGGSSLAGANEFAVRRRHDGESALVSAASTFIALILGEPMVRYDFKELEPIIGSPLGGVVYTSPRSGVRSVADLRSPSQRLTYGGISASGLDIVPLLAFEVLRLDVQSILGYPDRGSARLAFEQGETNIDYQTIPAYNMNVKPLIGRGDAVPLFSFGITDANGEVVRDPGAPDLPSVREVYVALFGREPEGLEWQAYKAVLSVGVSTAKVLWLHADAPPAAIAALRAAAAEVAVDPEFLEAVRVEVGDYPFYLGDEVTRTFAAASEVEPETLDWIRALLRDKFGLDRLQGG
jgi:tripartite-type tricarboxylate transporter receptor subunit TctC